MKKLNAVLQFKVLLGWFSPYYLEETTADFFWNEILLSIPQIIPTSKI
jgi:hypothetical protein